jgi:hypothetical protein
MIVVSVSSMEMFHVVILMRQVPIGLGVMTLITNHANVNVIQKALVKKVVGITVLMKTVRGLVVLGLENVRKKFLL